ncbi:unnamed protein product [Dovyalis caffra]|uniref:Uncharacterized protein n=1 Tax=Dovyalis caffra TaxID=77055 RepID=A0AAV1SV81_9ROSI|nr:unnamed protein product [Dovyalis caffra]
MAHLSHSKNDDELDSESDSESNAPNPASLLDSLLNPWIFGVGEGGGGREE